MPKRRAFPDSGETSDSADVVKRRRTPPPRSQTPPKHRFQTAPRRFGAAVSSCTAAAMQYMDFQSGYQQFLDLQKYMQWQGAGSSTGGAADYEQYMNYQKDYHQFLKFRSQYNTYQQFLEYRYMNLATSGTAAGKDVAANSTGTTLRTRLRVLRCEGARPPLPARTLPPTAPPAPR